MQGEGRQGESDPLLRSRANARVAAPGESVARKGVARARDLDMRGRVHCTHAQAHTHANAHIRTRGGGGGGWGGGPGHWDVSNHDGRLWHGMPVGGEVVGGRGVE